MTWCAWGKRLLIACVERFLFYKPIMKKLVTDSRIECREEVTCRSSAWLVIQLEGGAEQTVELLSHMVGRS